MKNNQDLVIQWLQEIILKAGNQDKTCYHIPYNLIETFDPSDKSAQDDIIDMYLDWPLLSDAIQAFRFDNETQSIYLLWYEPLKNRFPTVEPNYCCIDYEEMPASECWWDGTTQSTGYHDVFFTEVQLLHYVFKYYKKCGFTYWKDNGHYYIREDDEETVYIFEQCFCLVDGQLEIMYRTLGWNWSIIDEEHFKSVLKNSQSVTKIISKENEDMKDTVIIGRAFKKYTLSEREGFFKEALVPPAYTDDDKFDQWCEKNSIYIVAQAGVMELPYDADVVNEIDFSLKEMHRAIHGDGTATTGNTKGSEYPNATWKQFLIATVITLFDSKDLTNYDYHKAVQYTIHHFGEKYFKLTIEYIDKNWEELNDRYKVNFRNIEVNGMQNLYNEIKRREALREILCSNIEIEEGHDKDGRSSDRVFILDHSINYFGDLVGWQYGATFDIEDIDIQNTIERYKKELTK